MDFRFDGRRIPYQEGDTLASALHRHGERVLGRSLKYHRPRGVYCMNGSCASCLVDVDGEPNVPACVRAASGQEVRSQNRLGTARNDVLGVVDKAYRGGFEPHDAFTRPRMLNEAFLKAVRFMSGLGRAPPPGTVASPAQRRTRQVELLVVGGGRHGIAAASAHEGSVLLVDDGEALGGDAAWDPDQEDVLQAVAGLPAGSVVRGTCFGLYGTTAGLMVPVAPPAAPELWEVEATRIVVATGRHDAWPMFVNNDLPGVLSLRGAARLLDAHNVLPGRRIVVHGAPLPDALRARLEAAGATVVAQGQVDEASGNTGVERVRIGDAWHIADCIVCNLPGHPRIELLQQADVPLTFRLGALRPAPHAGAVQGRFTEAP